MSGSGTTFRGQPLVLLGVLLVGWCGMRVALWQSPWESGDGVALASSHPVQLPRAAVGGAGEQPIASEKSRRPVSTGAAALAPIAEPSREWLRRPLPDAAPAGSGWERLPLLAPIAPQPPRFTPPRGESPPNATFRHASYGTVIGHNLLMMAGLQGELPPALVAALRADPHPQTAFARQSGGAARIEGAPAPAGLVPNRRMTGRSRWTADAWVLLRDDSDSPRFSGRGAYGRSQAGAVLRYRLAPGSGHAPQAHLRGSVALDDPGNDLRDSEVAAGLSARPISAVPVRVAAEARVSDTSRGVRVRPAVYAVTELNPVPLPLGARGDLYLQGGYVGGDFATAFVDGQARVERPLSRAGGAEFFAGAAAWGGAQKNASRLDVGPSAGASLSVGRVRGRLTADYRFRVAGESRPASGPALTLYAGF